MCCRSTKKFCISSVSSIQRDFLKLPDAFKSWLPLTLCCSLSKIIFLMPAEMTISLFFNDAG
jgi:hypothetical protein